MSSFIPWLIDKLISWINEWNDNGKANNITQQNRRDKGAKLKKGTLETQDRQFYVKGSFRDIDISDIV